MAKNLRDPASVGIAEFTSSYDPIESMGKFGATAIKGAALKKEADETERQTSLQSIIDVKDITTKLDSDRVNLIVPLREVYIKKYSDMLASQNMVLTPLQQLMAKNDIATMKALAATSNAQEEALMKQYAFYTTHQKDYDIDASSDKFQQVLDPETWMENNPGSTDYETVKTEWEDSGKNILKYRELNPFYPVYKPQEDAAVFDVDAYVGTTLAKQVYTPSIQSTLETGDITTSSSIKTSVDNQIDKVLGDWYDAGVTNKGYDAKAEIDNRWSVAKQNLNSDAVNAKTAREWFISKYKPTLRTLSTSYSKTEDEDKAGGAGSKTTPVVSTEKTPINAKDSNDNDIILYGTEGRNVSDYTENISTAVTFAYIPGTGKTYTLYGNPTFKPQTIQKITDPNGNSYYAVAVNDISLGGTKLYDNVYLPFTTALKQKLQEKYNLDDIGNETITEAELKKILTGATTTKKTTTTTKINFGNTK